MRCLASASRISTYARHLINLNAFNKLFPVNELTYDSSGVEISIACFQQATYDFSEVKIKTNT